MLTIAIVIGVIVIGIFVLIPEKAEKKDYLIQLEKECIIQDIEVSVLLETRHFRLLAVKITEKEANELKKNDCVVRILTLKEARERYESLPEEVKESVRKKIREFRLTPSVPEAPKDLISEYQLYITPYDSAIQSLSKEVYGSKEAYTTAVNWVWVSDQTLNQVVENG